MIRVYVGGTLLAGTRSVMRGIGRLLVSPRFDPVSEKYDAEDGWVCKNDMGAAFGIRMKTLTTRFYDPADETETVEVRAEAAFLRATDVLVWVLDSQRARADGNRESLQRFRTSLTRLGKDPSTVPAVMVWNKQDLDELLSESEMEQIIQWPRVKQVATIATEGHGIEDVVSAIVEMVTYVRRNRSLM